VHTGLLMHEHLCIMSGQISQAVRSSCCDRSREKNIRFRPYVSVQ